MLKKLLIGLGILCALIVVAGLLAPSFISEEKIKEAVVAQAEELLGHDIVINGKLSFKVFPIAGVYMEDVTIGGNQKEPLATFKSMKVDVDTLALIGGNAVIKSLKLDTPVIHLIASKDGKKNWVGKTKEEDKIYVSGKGAQKTAPPIRGLSLEDVKISDGKVTYRDDSSGQKWQADKVNVSISLDDMNSPFEVNGKLDYNSQTVNMDSTLDNLSSFLNKQQATVEAKIKSSLLSIEGKGKVDGGSFTGTTSLASPSMTKAMEWLNQKPLGAKFASEFPLHLSSQASCSPDLCHFNKAKFELATIQATGDVKAHFSRKNPYVEMQLETNELDFNLFMTEPKQAGLSLLPSAYAAESWSNEPINFAALRAIDLVASIKATGIKMKEVAIGKTLFRAKIDRGVLSTDIVDAEFYGGKATVTASVDASGNTPVIQKQVDFRDINMEPFLKDAKISDRFQGKANFKMAMAGSGNSQRDIIGSMEGNGSIDCRDGSIKGVNIAQMIRNVQSTFKEVDKSAQKTDFSELGGTFNINKGVISNQDMLMKAPLLRVSGKGTVDLPQQQINYRITPEVVQTAQGQGGKEKEGLAVPVMVTGSLDNPRYTPDLQSTITEAIKDPEKVKAAVKDVKQQIKENKNVLKGLLKGFGGKEPAPAAGTATQPAQ